MTILEMLLWILGGLGVIVLICKAALWLERYFPGEEYDERQKIARGNAYRVYFYVSIIWLLLGLCLWIWLEEEWLFQFFALGIQIQIMTFNIYCFLTHADMPLSSKPKVMIRGNAAMAVYFWIQTVIAVRQNAQWPEKAPISALFRLSIAVGFAFMAILYLIQHLRDQKE